ncbi:MAG: phage baseplate assembly protein V [Pseudomonadota bacterium]
MDEGFHLAELSRKLSNMIRIGNIHAVDAAQARAKVALQGDEIITKYLPWISGRAGQTATYSAPEVGEQCVLFSPDGETANGIILYGLFSDLLPAPAESSAIHRIIFKDGASISYNHETGDLDIDVKGNVHVAAAASVHITAPEDMSISGNVNIEGDVAVTGKVTSTGDMIAGGLSLQQHIHTGDDGGDTSAGR